MKKVAFLLIVLITYSTFSQSNKKDNDPAKMVEDFFQAFHQQDTLALKSFALEGIRLQSVSEDEEGRAQLQSDSYSEFVKNIGSIPPEVNFEEKLHEFRVEENGLLATVTTPYTFYVNGNVSHCGVNSFTLVKMGGDWKIAYLIDTRSKENCK